MRIVWSLGLVAGLAASCAAPDSGADTAPSTDDTGTVDSADTDEVATFEIERLEVRQVNPGDLWIGWTATRADGCALTLSSGTRSRVVGSLGAGAEPQFLRLNFGAAPAVGAVDVALSCTGPDGVGERSARVVERAPVRLLARSVDPVTAPAGGGTVDLCWEASHADACTLYTAAADLPLGSVGCESVDVPAEGSFEGTLACDGGDSRVLEFVSLAAGHGMALDADPAWRATAGDVRLSWDVEGATDCALTNGVGASVGTGESGSAVVGVVQDETFTLSCVDGGGGSVVRYREVKVGPRVEVRHTGFTQDKRDLGLQWTTLGYDRCSLELVHANDRIVLDHLAPHTASVSTFADLTSWMTLYTDLEGAGDSTVTFGCDGPSGASEPVTLVLPEPGFVEVRRFEVLPDVLPTDGGQVDVCWDVRFATSCVLTVVDPTLPDEALVLPLGASGCLTDTGSRLTIEQPSEARLECQGGWDNQLAVRSISVGPTIRAFGVDTDAIEVPGTVTFGWDAVEIDACTLLDGNGSVIASGTSSAGIAVAVDQTTTFTLSCTADASAIEQELIVGVGPAILAFGARAEHALGATAWVRTTPFVDDCELYFDRADGWRTSQFGVVPGGFYPDLTTATWLWDFDVHGPLVATLLCNGSGGVLRETVTVPVPTTDLLPHVDAFTVAPAVAPEGPAEFHVCWQVTDTTGCEGTTSVSGQVFSDLDGAGCLDVVVDDDEEFYLTCTNPVAAQLGNRAVQAWLRVGPSVTAWSATPNVLFLDEGAPTSRLAWETEGMVACTLDTPSGTHPVAVDGTREESFPTPGVATPTLSCVDGAGETRAWTIEVATWPVR